MIDKVEALVRDVAATTILPRYQHLSADEIQQKGPGDLVTTADRDAEELLAAGLSGLLPGSRVVGEEAVAANPSVMSELSAPGDVWVVDPVDGTANFAAGREPFAVMVGLVRDGRAVLACILDPVSGIAATAEAGSGAYLGGRRAVAPRTARPAVALRGVSAVRHTPPAVRDGITAATSSVREVLGGHNCIGYEYPAIVRDEQQFAFFWRMLPWDHAPGILFVEEAGGVAWHLDGLPYQPASQRPGVLVAQNPETWHVVRTTLLAAVTASQS